MLNLDDYCIRLDFQTEKLFIEAQDSRRDAQNGINEVQARIKALHEELEKTHRGEDRYLTLITQVCFVDCCEPGLSNLLVKCAKLGKQVC